MPHLLVDWLATEPGRRHRALRGTFVFADISGFTALTERLAVRGRAGAEEMGDLLNEVFDRLLTAAYDLGASLLKWGGDAVLLLFEGPEHLQRGARAAWDMQAVMRATGRLTTSSGAVRLGMSIGVHTGELDVLLVGSRHRELVVVGPAATRTVLMEKLAERGQVVLSAAAAAGLPFACSGPSVGAGEGVLLARPPTAASAPNRRRKRAGVDLGTAMSPHLRDHLRGGDVEHEHRAATIGFVEFRGCDALLAAQGSTVLGAAVDDLLCAVQEAADAHQVTLLATDVGDDGGKVILTSGAPHAVGDAETRVLSAVRRVVDLDGPLALRGGVTCGSVFAGDYGPFYRRTYSVAGDVVNLAARLMARAAAGEVLTLPQVVERSRSPFQVQELEPFLVKGKRAPVTAVSVLGRATGSERDLPDGAVWDDTAFVGRQEELALLREAEAAAADGTGRVVELVAPPGLGKSRLVEELLRGSRALVLRADGDIYGSATPYQPMQRMLRRALDLPVDVDPARLRAALERLTADAAPDLLPYLPLIGVVAGVDLPSTPEVDVLDPQVRREHLERVTSDLLGRLLRRPVVMVLNDTHFMDEATVRLVARLAADAAARPWLLLVTRRPDAPSALDPAPHVTTVPLPPVDDASLAQLVTLSLERTPLPPHRRAELVRRSVGNPLFLRHLLAAVAAGADLEALPDTVEAIIAVQVDRLPAAHRRWLRAASVLGMTVDRSLLAEVETDRGDLPGPDGLPGLLEPGPEPGVLLFAHHLIRLTAYEGLPFRRRTALHGRLADLLEERGSRDVALLSLHSFHGQRHEAAWRYSRAAGDAAAEAYAPAEAEQCYLRALRAEAQLVGVPDAEVADTCERLARVALDLGEPMAAERALRQGRARVRDDPEAYARLVVRTVFHRHGQGRHGQALMWVRRGRATLAHATAPATWSARAELAEMAAIVRTDQGAYGAARRWAHRAVDEAARGDDVGVLARARGTAAVLDAITGHPVDEQSVRRTLDLYDEVGDLRGKATAANKLAMCQYFAGRWDEAARLYTLANEGFTRCGVESNAAAAAANLAELLVQQGLPHEAVGVLSQAMHVLRAAGAGSFLAFALMVAGRAALALDEHDLAQRHLDEARAMASSLGEVAETLVLDGLLAELDLRRGRAAQALDRVEAALAGAPHAEDLAGARAGLLRALGSALVGVGQQDEGRQVLRDALDSTRADGAGDDLVVALDAVLEHGAERTPEERVLWRQERGDLAAALGVRRPAPS